MGDKPYYRNNRKIGSNRCSVKSRLQPRDVYKRVRPKLWAHSRCSSDQESFAWVLSRTEQRGMLMIVIVPHFNMVAFFYVLLGVFKI